MSVNILLVEDNPADARLFRELLVDSGLDFTLTNATSRSEAMSHCQSGMFDIAILDLNLPDSKGLSGYVSLASEFPDVTIIILTGLDDQETATRAVRMGAQDYLVKGTTKPKALRHTINYSIERHRAIRTLRAETYQDPLTGVLNRRGLESLAMTVLLNNTSEFLLLYIDLDGLKWINDHLGHSAGDEAIKKTSVLLRCCLRPSDIIARLGGDEFVTLIPDANGLDVKEVLARIEEAVRKENTKFGRAFDLSFSVGVVKRALDVQHFAEAIAVAERLMYESKSRNKLSRFEAPRGGVQYQIREFGRTALNVAT